MAGTNEEAKHDPVNVLLNSRNILDKLEAVDMLKERGDVDRLLKLLRSESWHLRDRAKKALADFGIEIKSKVEPLMSERFWYIKSAAIYVLGEIGDIDAFDMLKSFITDKNRTVREESTMAIIKILKKFPKVRGKLSEDELLILENNLKSQKEFAQIEILKEKESGE